MICYDNVTRKGDERQGVLLSFKSVSDMTLDTCCHEASHACDAIEEGIGADHGGEAIAYLIGWIASCLDDAKHGIGNFIEAGNGSLNDT